MPTPAYRLAGSLTLYPRPVINSFQPAFGLAGDKVALLGAHYMDGGAAPQVEFGGVPATVVSAAVDRIEVTVPAGNGRVPVVVKRPLVGGFALSLPADFKYRPLLTAFAPPYALRGGLLTITGQNFDPNGDNDVYIGGAQTQVISVSATTLVVRVNPASFGSGIQVFSMRAPSELVAGMFPRPRTNCPSRLCRAQGILRICPLHPIRASRPGRNFGCRDGRWSWL
ncbi:MAG: IPT/TIG domain-containing protein [Fibrobacterota bacterium]|nr:IPT/TIG domain-containing protein [Fibrobacterota bacterium]